MMSYPAVKEFRRRETVWIFKSIPKCYGRTDGQTYGIAMSKFCVVFVNDCGSATKCCVLYDG